MATRRPKNRRRAATDRDRSKGLGPILSENSATRADHAAQLSETLVLLARQARRRGLSEVAHIVEVAALAADEARAGQPEPTSTIPTLKNVKRFYSA